MDSTTSTNSKTAADGKTNNEKYNRGNSMDYPVKSESNSNRGRKSQKRKNETNDDAMNKKFTRKWDGKTRREKNVDTRTGEEAEEGEKEERRPKKKVACFIGYSGEGYHGMQLYVTHF